MYNKFDYMNYILNYDQNKMVWKWVNECERQKLFSWNCCTSSAEFSYRLNPAEIYFKLWLEFRARALNFRHSALTWADEPLQLKFGSCVTCLCKCLLVCHVPERYGYRVQSMDSAKLRCSRLEIVSKYRRINSQLEGATPQWMWNIGKRRVQTRSMYDW